MTTSVRPHDFRHRDTLERQYLLSLQRAFDEVMHDTCLMHAPVTFVLDRGGFRVFVLSPVPRRDILLGKNLAVAPIALVLCSFIAVLIEVLYPMRIDHLLALAPHWISMYLLFCMLMNLMSILAPMRPLAGWPPRALPGPGG